MQQTKPARSEFLLDVLDAARLGTDHWSHIVQGDDGHWMIEDTDEPKEYRMPFDTALIEEGIKRVLRGDFEVNPDIHSLLIAADEENDATDVDIAVADVVVQAAMFGGLVYSYY